eukprot:CAMPEP_0176070750 /NCGR_PEP_ID=MMETSP0120_2-20121206/35335_1 /TAXON_ID=160619 /ORGANISM="Kryptoperidinium foliaceum, Strain CCMP 1326" /LENGTH=267 /DNA_ID=CAMNT_0017404403 /DNA_START=91 /DNA_END=890 /DNA_ORIENTATION=-
MAATSAMSEQSACALERDGERTAARVERAAADGQEVEKDQSEQQNSEDSSEMASGSEAGQALSGNTRATMPDAEAASEMDAAGGGGASGDAKADRPLIAPLPPAELSAGDSSTDEGQGSDDDQPAGGAPPSRDGVPSMGSAAHFSGECTPCCFFFKNRCRNGESCQFCHLPHEKRSRGRGCRGHGTTKKERLPPAMAQATTPSGAPGLLLPPPGLELFDTEADPVPRSFLATKPPAGTFMAAPPAPYQSLLLPEASSRPVSPAMALG